MLKTLIRFSLVLLTLSPLSGQNFIALPNDSIEASFLVNDWASDYIYIRNTASSSVALSYQTISNTMTPAGWDVVLCTNNACFPYVPSSGTFGTVAAGDSAYFHLQCGFMGIAGTQQIRVRIYETNNPAVSDTVTFIYHALTVIGVNENTFDKFLLTQNYPNPFTESTIILYQLSGNSGELIVTDVEGKEVANYSLYSPTGQVAINNLTPGVYCYMLRDENGISLRRMMIAQ
jgi:hypothetical protein